ncbi:hypothetical protein ACNKHW_17210 [Shigella flexneri]
MTEPLLANRQQAIAALTIFRPDYNRFCGGSGDLERVLARLALRHHRADLARMRHAFSVFPDIQAQLSAISVIPYIQTLQQRMGQFDELQSLLERAVVEAPPVLVRDGGVIAPGYDEELDEWRFLADGASDYQQTGNPRTRKTRYRCTLKVGFNGVHGFWVGEPRTKPCRTIHYVRRQTLKTPALYHSGTERSPKIRF